MPSSYPGWQTLGKPTYALGESPFWHPHEQALYWIDIVGKQILRSQPDTHSVQAWAMPSEPGCIAPCASGGLVIALRHGVFRAHNWGGPLEHLLTLPYDTASVRANDGKCDAQGRFWVGTVDESKSQRAGALFSIDCRSASPVVQQMAGDALTANGLAWSLAGDTLYWADTPSHVVHAWDYNGEHNTMAQHRTHLRFAGKPEGWQFASCDYAGRPDGATIDSHGNYWVAMYEGQRVCCFSPEGQLLESLATPALCPTMPCFGGADLKTLFVTSVRHGRSPAEIAAYPDSGAVFYQRIATAGTVVQFFREA
jgi:sugar lactone lactonase YvrE